MKTTNKSINFAHCIEHSRVTFQNNIGSKKICYIALLLISSFIMYSCKESNTFNNTDIDFKSANASFFGDPDWHKVYYLDLYLFDKNLTANQNGSGIMIFLALNCENTEKNTIKSGTYPINSATKPQAYTIERGVWNINTTTNEKNVLGSYVGIIKDGKVIENKLIVSGSIVVNRMGNYTITGIVTTEDNLQYKVNFKGGIPIDDMVVPLPNTLTHGEIWYWGNIYNNNMNVYTIRLAAQGVNLSTFIGKGDAMQIEFYTPINAINRIPNGIYPIKTIGENIVNTSLAGEYNENDKADYGTLYYTADKLFVNQGYITITYNGNISYNLNFNFTDDYYGYNFKDNFNIDLPLVNRANNAPKQIRTKQLDKTNNSTKNTIKSKTKFNRYSKSNSETISEMIQR